MTQLVEEEHSRLTLCLIDISGLFWANWHATVDQEIGEAFRRTVDRVHRLAEGFDYVAVCCDYPPYKRKALSADYKAQRDTPDAAAVEQFTRIKERLTADGFLLWSAQGYEADDVIATACYMAREDDLDVTIASADKDLLQLVGPTVRVQSTKTGDFYDSEAVLEKFGVPPVLVGDLLALMGDASDNVRGVRGIGIKSAAKLLRDFGTLNGILEAAAVGHEENLKPKQREALNAAAAEVKISRRLIELCTDVPIEWSDLYKERKAKPLTESPSPEDFVGDVVDAEFEDEASSQPEAEQPKEDVTPVPANNAPKIAAPTTAIVAHQPWAMQLEPKDSGSAWKLAQILYNSRLYSKFASPEAILAIVLRGRSLGLDATTALDNFHMVEGKPTMHADLIRGLVIRSGLCEYFNLLETTEERATWVTKRKGSDHETRITWTMQDALAAGLVTKNGDGYRGVSKSGKPSIWDKYRRNQLKQRAGVELARTVYPDITANLYTPEEIEGNNG